GEKARVLLGVERVSARTLDKRRFASTRRNEASKQRLCKDRGVLGIERSKRDRGRVCESSSPLWMCLEQLWSRGADHEHGDAGRPLGEVLHECQYRWMRPVHVLEHEDERLLRRNLVEEPLPGGEDLFALTSFTCESDQRGQPGAEPCRVGHAGDCLV